MELSEISQDLLEKLWTALEEEQRDSISINELGLNKQTSRLSELVDRKLVLTSGNLLELTAEGRREAENAIRRHRLAERLLNDVLATQHHLMEENACKFEHLLYEGIDDSICTLLGHPKVCPHGKPIPPGKCCRQEKERGSPRLVAALADLNPGQKGKIAYVQSRQSQEIQKLMAIGILPGTPIHLIRRFPSYVFEIGNTQYAVDRNIANEIYVRLEN
ncbi:metal-dependent transcriptional regulator [Candidatus Poribacteria bacterium]|nr:metal-dependent transcriptional regulator [Candidatus Poribacteria bacterium]